MSRHAFMNGMIEQTFGGGYISPAAGTQTSLSPYGQGGGTPFGGAYLGPGPQANKVPVVQGNIMYSQRVNRAGGKKGNFQNPNWPFQGPTGGQMWLQ
jgi:hypothetical protein